MASRVWRSMLFVPANSWRMIMRSLGEMQDAVILDLEDAVPIAEKETARVFAKDSASILKSKGIVVLVRVNSLGTNFTEEDLKYVVTKDLDGIMLPKSESKENIQTLDSLLKKEEENKNLEASSVAILPLLESPKGVMNAFEIASASHRICGLGFGAGDFLRELGEGFTISRLTPDEFFPLILYARSIISIAASVVQVPAIDTPFFGLLIDNEGLIRESSKAKMLGFKGKMIIHPRHVDPVNEVFSPSKEDVEFAKQMIEAYKEAEARGLGAASFGGRMIDHAMFKMGEDLIARAQAFSDKDQQRLKYKHAY